LVLVKATDGVLNGRRTRKGLLRKEFYLKDGVLKSSIATGTFFQVVRPYSNKEVTLELIEKLLHLPREKNLAILPNGPVTNGSKPFRRLNKNLADSARNWMQLDIEWMVPCSDNGLLLHDPHNSFLHETVTFVFEKLGLPSHTGYVAQRSAKAKLVSEIRVRIYVLLDTPLNQAELDQHFSAYDIDHTMCQKGRLHLIHPPLIRHRDIKTYECKGPDIIRKDGPALEVAKLRLGSKPEKQITIEGERVTYRSNNFIRDILTQKFGSTFTQYEKDTFEDFVSSATEEQDIFEKSSKTLKPWKDRDSVYKALEEITSSNPEIWNGNRNYGLWWILKDSFLSTGNFYEGLAFIFSNAAVRGDWSEKAIFSKCDAIKKFYLDRWNCGDITRRFAPQEIVNVNHFDLAKLSEQEFADIPREGILCFWSACGTGKTKLARRLFEGINPDRLLTVCFRRAVLAGYAKGVQEGGFGCDYYENYEAEQLPLRDWLAINILSLKKILRSDETFVPYDIVFLDEIEHILEELIDKPVVQGYLFTGLSTEIELLFEVCRRAKLVVVADDKMSDGLTGWFVSKLSEYNSTRKSLLKNEADYVSLMNFHMLDSRNEAFAKIVELAQEGKRVAVQVPWANNKKFNLLTAEQVIREMGNFSDKEVLAFEAEDTIRTNTIRKNPNSRIEKYIADGLRIIICSPFNQVGWSYESEASKFDATVTIAGPFDHAHDIKQGLRRWRFTMDHYVYISKRKDFLPTTIIDKTFSLKKAHAVR